MLQCKREHMNAKEWFLTLNLCKIVFQYYMRSLVLLHHNPDILL